MAGTGRKWLVGCGVGCAVTALLGIIITVGGGLLMSRPLNRAASTQEELTERYGDRSAYRPPLEGLDRHQLKRFIAVRRDLQPLCVDFREIGDRFRAMDEMDSGNDDPGAGEVIKAVGGVMGAAFGMAGKLGTFSETRNKALLAQEMSLGEYAWIYVLAYNSWLAHPPNESFEEGETGLYSRAERRTLHTLLDQHADDLAEAGRLAESRLWRGEAELVMERSAGAPFTTEGLPLEIRAELEAFRHKLEDLYCPDTASFEWSQVKKKGGFGFEAN
ncbi:MAG: hypothetical protein GY838_04795 [bacterium]|nr:hypothetical protein [bacterium]